jgi:hypothetical protein
LYVVELVSECSKLLLLLLKLLLLLLLLQQLVDSWELRCILKQGILAGF